MSEPLDNLQMDGVDCIRHVNESRTRGTVMVDEGSGKVVLVEHKTVADKGSTGMTDAKTVWQTVVEHWVKHYGKPLHIRTDPEGCYRSKELHDFAEQHDIWWDVSPGEAHWRQGRAEVAWSLLQVALNKMATLDPECPVGELFSWVGAAHNEMFRAQGASPDQVIFGRSRRPLDSELLGSTRQLEAEATEGSPA